MTYAELMAKIKKGEALTTEEADELVKVSRPSDRFNEVSAKAQTLEQSLRAKDEELKSLQNKQVDENQRLQDEVQKQLAELSGKVETLTTERDTLAKERDGAVKSIKVRDLAQNNPTGAVFGDADYLKYLLDKEQVDLNDADKVKTVLLSLKEKMPEQFKVPARGGSGSGLGNQAQQKSTTKSLKDWTDADKAKFLQDGHTVDDFMVLMENEGV